MCDPKLYVFPNCTAEQISLETYESQILEYDNRVADACHPVGIHHCGSVDEVLKGYAKVRHLEFIEIGFGSDVRRTRELFGPDVAVNARISPVLMKNGTPQEVAAEVRRLIDNGAPLDNFSIDTVGLTYGTPDENVKTALKTAAQYGKIRRDGTTASSPQSVPYRGKVAKPLESTVGSATQRVTIGASHPLVIIGERINPTGRKELAASLEAGNLDLVRSEALLQVKAGARILDVNVGVSGIDEPEMLKKAILALQALTDIPLCIDSASSEALAEGLAVYKGKALVNSVNGETHKLETVLPLVKAHNAAVIGLTMDDKGIPKQAEERLEIARLIVDKALELSIAKEDVIIDPLAMAVSADDHAGLETLRALRLIRDELGVNQTVGLSNVSFGLPERTSINGIFLAMAVINGLTCPIADPTVWDMKRAVLLTDLLMGKDEFCMNYLAASANRREGGSAPIPAKDMADTAAGLERIKEAVILGDLTSAVRYTEEALNAGC